MIIILTIIFMINFYNSIWPSNLGLISMTNRFPNRDPFILFEGTKQF